MRTKITRATDCDTSPVALKAGAAPSSQPAPSVQPFYPAGFAPDGAGRYMGISRSRVYELLADRQLKAVKIGSRTVVLRASCDDFLNRCPPAYPKSEVV